MSATIANAASLPGDSAPIADARLDERSPAPPTPLLVARTVNDHESKEDINHHTFVVDLTHYAARPKPLKGDDLDVSAIFSSEQRLGSLSDPLPSAHPLSPDPLSSSEVDLSSAGTALGSGASGSETVDTPTIDPPGLPACDHVGNVNISAREVQDIAEVVSPQSAKTTLQSGPPDKIAHIKMSAFDEYLSRFSLSGLPKLDTFIPYDLLPDNLIVYDPDNITTLRPEVSKCDIPVRYVRMYPKPSRERGDSRYAYADKDPNSPPCVAQLYLQMSNDLGTGNHSSVYRAPLRLRLDSKYDEWSTASVAVKVAHGRCGPHSMLDNEARAYDEFPRRFMEDCCPSSGSTSDERAPPQANNASDTSQRACHGQDTATEPAASEPALEPEGSLDPAADKMVCRCGETAPATQERQPALETAIVPKFYGYYWAVCAEGTQIRHSHEYCGKDGDCAISWPTSLLLMEECGVPIYSDSILHLGPGPIQASAALRNLVREHRTNFISLYERLHEGGFVNGSAYTRNMLVQPGPLSAPPEQRSYDKPSYRIIDFGRAEVLSRGEMSVGNFECLSEEEISRAKRQLWLCGGLVSGVWLE